MEKKKVSKINIAGLIVAWLAIKVTKETLRNKGVIR